MCLLLRLWEAGTSAGYVRHKHPLNAFCAVISGQPWHQHSCRIQKQFVKWVTYDLLTWHEGLFIPLSFSKHGFERSVVPWEGQEGIIPACVCPPRWREHCQCSFWFCFNLPIYATIFHSVAFNSINISSLCFIQNLIFIWRYSTYPKPYEELYKANHCKFPQHCTLQCTVSSNCSTTPAWLLLNVPRLREVMDKRWNIQTEKKKAKRKGEGSDKEEIRAKERGERVLREILTQLAEANSSRLHYALQRCSKHWSGCILMHL